MTLPRRWGLAMSGWLALAALALPDATPLRVAVVAAFLLTCPGLALTLLCAGRLRPPGSGRSGPLEAALLTGAVSLSLSVLVAEALFLGHAFTPGRAVLILAAITSAAVLAAGRRARDTVRRTADDAAES
ncbi:hypothetical protein ACIRPP_10780 [Streptomyces sp. NPDC101219]|uniref:hypothetical protein n=1 Tax=Streptomyces sp. NPDC101219 TaxID=3366131 RepID=UPI00382D4F06